MDRDTNLEQVLTITEDSLTNTAWHIIIRYKIDLSRKIPLLPETVPSYVERWKQEDQKADRSPVGEQGHRGVSPGGVHYLQCNNIHSKKKYP